MRNDPARLDALQRLMILDTAPERKFDDLTRLLADTLDVPIVMMNMLDADRDWFKSCVGVPGTESAAQTSFCEAFFDTTAELIVVEDTLKDHRFADNPFVSGSPYIRFYAGARLVVDGQTIGTLCAYDTKTRRLTPHQLDTVRTLAEAVIEQLSARDSTTP